MIGHGARAGVTGFEACAGGLGAGTVAAMTAGNETKAAVWIPGFNAVSTNDCDSPSSLMGSDSENSSTTAALRGAVMVRTVT